MGGPLNNLNLFLMMILSLLPLKLSFIYLSLMLNLNSALTLYIVPFTSNSLFAPKQK